MLRRPVSKLLKNLSPVISHHRTALHFEFEPEEAKPEWGPTKKMNMCNAIVSAQDIQLERDESTIIFGEDVKFGGVFRCTVRTGIQ